MAAFRVFRVLVAVLSTLLLACSAENREIYLVLMEDEAAAFHASLVHENERNKIDTNHEIYKAHAGRLVYSHHNLLQIVLEIGSYTKLHSFSHIINGFSVHTTPSQAEKLRSAPGVKLVERDRGAKLMTTYTPKFLELPDRVWSQKIGGYKNTGEGIVIGFIDTGIDPTHPSFAYDLNHPFTSNISHFSGDCETGPGFLASSCNGKIVSARFFAAGAQAVYKLNASVDFLSPLDAAGHGSHVASTAAGNAGVPVIVDSFYYGRASGMAPRARIAVYKALYPSGGTSADVIAAIDQATRDGVDILNLSVGPDSPPEDRLTFFSMFDLALLFARRAGVFVVQAAGNNGPEAASVVSFSPWAMSAASCNTDRTYPSTLILGNGIKIRGVGLSGPTFGKGMFQYKMVLAKDAMKANGTFPRTPKYVEECQHPEALDINIVQGNIIVCNFSSGFDDGTSSISAMVDTAKALRAKGFVLVANREFGDFIAEPVPFDVPGIMIPRIADAKALSQYYEEQTRRDGNGVVRRFCARARIGEGRAALVKGRSPVVSRFSSRGPDLMDANRTLADVLKPDILAPGHQVWAAWTPISASDPMLRGCTFAMVSGTSMATPHVAGIAALVKQHNPSWTPSMIQSAISTTATKHDSTGDLIMAQGYALDDLYSSSPFAFGSGFITPSLASDPGLVFPSTFQDYISFLCSLPNMDPQMVRAATGASCARAPALDRPSSLNLPSVTISALNGTRVVRRTVKNVGGKQETYLGSVMAPNGTVVDLSPTWFTIAPEGTQDLEIRMKVTVARERFSFGEVVLTGSLNHIVRVPLSVRGLSVT